jgi:CheY-like chemotaxis protein
MVAIMNPGWNPPSDDLERYPTLVAWQSDIGVPALATRCRTQRRMDTTSPQATFCPLAPPALAAPWLAMGRPRVLLVDDNPGDIALTQEAFAENHLDAEFVTAGGGEEAQRLLAELGDRASGPELALIVLDLNLPRINGAQLLAFCKQHPRLKLVPTVMLTTSNRAQDRDRCMELGAEDYLVKPAVFSEFLELVEGLRRYF